MTARTGANDIRAVIFDKDGVLVDFERTWTPVVKAAARDLAGDDESRAANLLAAVGYRPLTDDFAPGSVWAVGTNDDLLEAWLPDADTARREAFLRAMAERCERAPLCPAVPAESLRAGLEELHGLGLKLAVATNDTTASAERMIRLFGIEEYVDHVVGFDAVRRPKPAPDPVLAVAEALALPPAACVVVGDSPHDAEMARAAGCAAFIGVLDGTSDFDTLAPLADHLADDVLEAIALCRRLASA